MPHYRLYYLNGRAGIDHFREFDAADDMAAIRQAAEWRSVEPMELWSGARKVKAWQGARSARTG